jgi:hypothetical protein
MDLSIMNNCTITPFAQWGKKLSFDSGGYGRNKYKWGYGSPYGGVWRSVYLAGVWSLESVDRFCVGEFGTNLTSIAVNMFTLSTYFKAIL